MNKSFWQTYAVFYDAFMRREKKLYAEMARRIAERLTPGDDVLEAGAGTGIISAAIAPYARHVECCDYAPNMVRRAQRKMRRLRRGNVSCSVRDIKATGYPIARFSVVIAANVLHLLSEPEKAVAELRRVCKPGGFLVLPIFLPQPVGEKSLSVKALKAVGFEAKNGWSAAAYHAFLHEQGLRVVEQEILPGFVPSCYVVAQ